MVRRVAGKRAPERPPLALRVEVTEANLLRPPIRPGFVPRTDLIERLRSSDAASVVAVVAPAGYGKTTLLSEWAERDRRPFAWVSVDPGASDPVVLLAHIAVALDRLEVIDASVFAAIASPGASNPERIVRRLGRAMATREHPFVLVLDDLDRCGEPLALDAVATLTNHLPAGSVMAIAARTVPDVRLPRLRAEGRLTEIGVEDLALDATEARALLRGVGTPASKEEAEVLARSTEGWPVGLYLSALSSQQQRRSGAAPIRFTGDDRFLTEYIRSEVLKPLSRERQRFLTRTSILQRLSGPLCDAVLDRSGSARTLESIERSNLLLVPLDRERRWYRYHHLFADVLRSELERREPDVIPELHRRAADWFEANGLPEMAMTHAYLGGDEDHAAELLQRTALRAYQVGRIATLRAWIDRLGDDVITRNVGLAILAAWVGSLSGDTRSADRWAEVVDGSPVIGPSLHGTASLRSSAAIMHTINGRGGMGPILSEAELAEREEGEGSPFRTAVLGFLGLASIAAGDDDRADRLFAEAVEIGSIRGDMPGVSTALGERSLIAAARGDREAASQYADRARSIVLEAHLQEHITTGPVLAACARAALRAGDKRLAQRELTAAQSLRPTLSYAWPLISVQTRLELARIHVGLSDVAGARTLLAEVDEILRHRPDLGVFTEMAAELRKHVGSVRSGWSPGPSTLTTAELRVLNLLPTHLSFREIGGLLYVSPNTVKTQAISIYRKLGVSTRSDAVRSARELGLLEA